MQNQNNVLKIQYRNASYQGGIQQGKRNSFGVLITDKSQILLGNWQNNKINGIYAYISDIQQAYGQMRNSVLNSFNVITYENLTIYGYFKEGLLQGRAVFKYQNKLQLLKYEKGFRKQLLEQYQLNKDKLYSIIKKQFKEISHSLRSFLANKINQQETLKTMNFKQLILNAQYKYYGFSDKKGQGNGLGIVFKHDFIHSCGWYSNTQLNGIGRTYISNQQIHDGIFINNVLKGIGIKYTSSNNKYTYGIHSDEQQLEKGVGFPIKQILDIKKQFHLRSINFDNKVIMLNRLINIEKDKIIMKDIQKSNLLSRIARYSKSPNPLQKIKDLKNFKQQSPLRARLKTYQKQSSEYQDLHIQKIQPMELYQPINRIRNNTTKSRKSYYPQEQIRKKKFYYQQVNGDLGQKYYRQQNQRKLKYQDKMQRSKLSQEDSLIYKETVDMIKILQKEQMRKRQDLARMQNQQQQGRPRNKRMTYA